MSNIIICIGDRCSSWGKSWPKHLYSGNEDCLRCGMNRREQWEEDKAAGLVSGDYKPYVPRPKQPVTSTRIQYCALGEEGIEFVADTRKACGQWIADQIADGTDPDYYAMTRMTKAELAALPEN